MTADATWRSPSIAGLRMLSDGRAAALLGPDAEIVWFCRPRFHSPPVCWTLLDRRGGNARWLEATHVGFDGDPAGPTTRTTLRVGHGPRIEVWDGLVPAADGGSDLIRLVRGLDADLDVWHSLRLGGFEHPWAEWTNEQAVFADAPSLFVSGGSSTFGADGTALTQLRAPRDVWAPVVLGSEPGLATDAEVLARRLSEAESTLRRRLDGSTMSRTHTERVRHTLAVLEACTDRETGAVIASPTTSLPEVVGGDRQFDYRYSWLRDSSVAIAVASLVGQHALAEQYVEFLARIGSELILAAPVRTVTGDTIEAEHDVADVEGWCGSRPVRVGNAAGSQLQFDAIGFVLDALVTYRSQRRRLGPRLWTIARALADRAAERADDDVSNGIWEIRDRAAYVSGDIGCWLALDRALRLGRRRLGARGVRRRWKRARDEVRARVLEALRPDGTLPQVYGGDDADASALLLVVFGLLPPGDPRAQTLVDGTIAALGAGPLLHRYPPDGHDGFAAGEAPFLPASWWAVTALAVVGHPDAQARADQLCEMLPMLQPEVFDPARREALGNTPLLWSHAECARALFELDRQRSLTRRLRRLVSKRRVGSPR
jgi:predicted dinucleotide-binding enzyme